MNHQVKCYKKGLSIVLEKNEIANRIVRHPGDVKNVLDRYAYYVVENLKKGYAILLLEFGALNIRFIKTKTVSSEKIAPSTRSRM